MYRDIKSVREQHKIFDKILKDRIDNLMPKLLEETGIDMWVIVCREYNEDPIYKTITPALVRNATRMSAFAFTLIDGKYEALSFSRPNPILLDYYTQEYKHGEETQFEAIARSIGERKPRNVAVNVNSFCAMADGLSEHLHSELVKYIPDVEIITDHNLAIRWLETRVASEIEIYPQVYKAAMDVLDDAYSLATITPGITTTADVEYFIMQTIGNMGLDCWFSPTVDFQREGDENFRGEGVINEGDILHTDMGLVYLGGLYTDTQRLAYVAKKSQGESSIPKGLLDGFAVGNRFQDIVGINMQTNKTGNEILVDSLMQAKEEGINATLYTHPIGLYGHAAGPTIGLWDNQGFVAGSGENKLHENTAYALELNIVTENPDWDNQKMCFMLEETILYRNGKIEFLDGKREQIKLII